MKRFLFVFIIVFTVSFSFAQSDTPHISNIDLAKIPAGTINKYWLDLLDNAFGQPISIPIIIAKGMEDVPVLGLTAAIHGDELNGIPIIQQVFQTIDVGKLKGTVIAIPGLNALGFALNQRDYIDDVDLNRIFPGSATGDVSQQYVWQIRQKVLPLFDLMVDMHTASFGNLNTFYVRADLTNDTLKQMAYLQNPDIILDNAGLPSAGASAAAKTMRAEAILMGIPTITVEYGNPQVYQKDMIERGIKGILSLVDWLGMQSFKIENVATEPVLCKKSYWIYTDAGGLLEVYAELNQIVEKGELIATLKNPFGDVLKQYLAPERGVIIGKSANPVAMSGGRIVHFGILTN